MSVNTVKMQFDKQLTVDHYVVSFPNSDTIYGLEVHTLIDESKDYIVLDEDNNIIDCEELEHEIISQYHLMMAGSTIN